MHRRRWPAARIGGPWRASSGAELALRTVALPLRTGRSSLSKQRALDFAKTKSMPAIVLARPFVPANVGAVARAMANFGFSELRVAASQTPSWRSHADCLALAAGANSIVEGALDFGSAAEAIADYHYVIAATARSRKLDDLPVLTPAQAAQALFQRRGQRTALLFGSERDGLSTDELRCADAVVTIETAADFPALNLSHAVLLLCYECSKAVEDAPRGETPADVARVASRLVDTANLADGARLASFFAHVDSELRSAGFYAKHARRKRADMLTMAKLRRLILRATPTAGDVGLLRGVIDALKMRRAENATR
ncbi:Alpha/beta knot methyltransferase [Pelagophyceae sp. CCMP2097]|nr:Alpha/beta knot methyltransferase [Pelagophyceae sp. CCMP2097]